tara:strand:+ start:172 stop:456 length:285 start_codon:yes stop_codon:yes gene_type:complete
MKKEVKIMNVNTRYMESTGRTRQVTPRMMEYLGHVIDTPTVGAYGDNGKAPDEVIGKKMYVTSSRIGSFRSAFKRMFTKEEVMELCEEVMKEAA